MDTVLAVLPYIQVTLSILLIAAVLLQQSDAGVGGAFGGGDNFSAGFHTRRGFERILFISTIIIGILFTLSALVALIGNSVR
jgi:protein translocase SecG subunit